MDILTGFGLVSVVALVLANAFFVATEFSIVAIRRSRLEQLVTEGRSGARVAKDIVGHLDAYIAACQFGITLASLALGWIGEPVLAHLIEPPLERFFGSFAPAASHTIALSIAFAFITGLHIVIGELAPKGVALQRTEGTILIIAVPMRIFYRVFQWPILLLNAVGNGVLKLMGMRPASAHETVHSIAELRFLLGDMEEAGVMDTAEVRIASRAFEFGDLMVGSIATPRVMLEALPVTSSLGQVVAWAKSTKHRRLLIYEDSIDHIIGLVHIGDIFKVLGQDAGQFDIRQLIRPVMTVPKDQQLGSLLEQMRTARQHLAVVIDEHHGTAGIVTVEDLVEALVGPIDQEPDLVEEDIVRPESQPEPDGSLLLNGIISLEEVSELLGISLPRPDNVRTLGGLVTYHLGRIPQVGETIETRGCVLEVRQIEGARVALVKVLITSDTVPQH
jgi:CBS domain containing-hemolysin-like protein